MPRRFLFLVPLLVLAAVPGVAPRVQEALESIRARDLRAHLFFLSHDRLEGRGPGTRGGQLAALYISSQFARSGVLPPAGGYLQAVPLVGSEVVASGLTLSFGVADEDVRPRYPEDVVVWTQREDTAVGVTGELMFVGHGVDAPEYSWDDFKGRDVEGSVLLFLVNDPPAPPDEPELFDGRALSYYGRWTYKLEEAARRGAAAAFLVHTEPGAGYGWDVVESSWTGEQFFLQDHDSRAGGVPVAGWVTRDFAARLLARAGFSLEELTLRAARRDFRPVGTGIRVNTRFPTRQRRLHTANVVGMVPGRTLEGRAESVVYTAHYDHLGVGAPVGGDSIYNGAYDNASGVAALLEIAEAFTRLEPGPERTIIFVATAAEEAGLLGAEHYARNPVVPLERTLAAFNLDGANLWGETDDVVGLGGERSTLGRILEARARELDMDVRPDPAPDKGFFFRSDHFPFARAGVPVLYLQHGLTFRGRPAGWGEERLRSYEERSYHRPSDEFDSSFDLSGAVQQARLAFLVGWDVAEAAEYPAWYEGAGFGRANERPPASAGRGPGD